MGDEEAVVRLQAELDRERAERASLERVLEVTLEVITDAQWGTIRARLDAEDAARVPR